MIIDTYFHQSQDRKTVKCDVIGGKKSVSLKFCFNGLNLYVGAMERIYTVSDLGFVHLTRGYQNKVFDIVYEWPKTKQRYLLSPSEMLGRASNEVPFFYSCLTAQTSVTASELILTPLFGSLTKVAKNLRSYRTNPQPTVYILGQ